MLVADTAAFSIPGKALNKTLSLLKSCHVDKPSFYLEYQSGNIIITKHSEKDYLRATISVENAAPGKYEFPLSESCFSFIDKFKDRQITFSVLEGGCLISPSDSGASFRMDFPENPIKPEAIVFSGLKWSSVSAVEISKALDFLDGMRSTKEPSNFNGIEFYQDKLLSTNGFIAAEISALPSKFPNFVLPDSGCDALYKLANKAPDSSEIQTALVENRVIFSVDSILFSTVVKTEEKELRAIKLISDIMNKCEESCVHALTISTSDFKSKWALFKSAKKGKLALFSLSNGNLAIESQEEGYALRADIPCCWEKGDRTFKMDSEIVKLFLSKVSEETLVLKFSDSPVAPIFYSSGEKRALIQPVR